MLLAYKETVYEQCLGSPLFPPSDHCHPSKGNHDLTSNTIDYFYLFLNILCSYMCDFFILHNVDEIHLYCCIRTPLCGYIF